MLDLIIHFTIDLFMYSPTLFSVCILYVTVSKIKLILLKYRLKRVAHLPADQKLIESSLARWRNFRPDVIPIILNDLTAIRREHEVVRNGHLVWLTDKVFGRVALNACISQAKFKPN